METEINLGEDIVYKVTNGDETYMLREPSVEEVKGFSDKEDDRTSVDSFFDLIITLGMPEDVARKMPVRKVTKLCEGILQGFKDEKK